MEMGPESASKQNILVAYYTFRDTMEFVDFAKNQLSNLFGSIVSTTRY